MAGFPERKVTLRDGTPVLLREARPEDAPLEELDRLWEQAKRE